MKAMNTALFAMIMLLAVGCSSPNIDNQISIACVPEKRLCLSSDTKVMDFHGEHVETITSLVFLEIPFEDKILVYQINGSIPIFLPDETCTFFLDEESFAIQKIISGSSEVIWKDGNKGSAKLPLICTKGNSEHPASRDRS